MEKKIDTVSKARITKKQYFDLILQVSLSFDQMLFEIIKFHLKYDYFMCFAMVS